MSSADALLLKLDHQRQIYLRLGPCGVKAEVRLRGDVSEFRVRDSVEMVSVWSFIFHPCVDGMCTLPP